MNACLKYPKIKSCIQGFQDIQGFQGIQGFQDGFNGFQDFRGKGTVQSYFKIVTSRIQLMEMIFFQIPDPATHTDPYCITV